MNRYQAAGPDRMRLREHDEGRSEFIHVVHALHAVAIEQRLIHGVLASDGARMRDGQPGRELRYGPTFSATMGMRALLCLLERAEQVLRIARRSP